MLAFHILAKILDGDSKAASTGGTFLIEIDGPGHDGISFHREYPTTNLGDVGLIIIPQSSPSEKNSTIKLEVMTAIRAQII
jgi:hypothetical protein